MVRSKSRAAVILGALFLSACATTSWDESTPPQCRVKTASVRVLCVVAAEGALRDCRVENETPPGCGFAEAALRNAERATMRVTGNTREGMPVTFKLEFRNGSALV